MPGHNRRKCPKLSSNVITTENEAAGKEQDQVTLQQLGVTDEVEDEKTKRLPGTTTIIGMKNSRKCGQTYSPFLQAEIEDVETVDNRRSAHDAIKVNCSGKWLWQYMWR
ncbi:hypothetical protein V1508DRAFT_171548 [Lipomyces doorenjongii]|uniref:uncharacterized protein n=1 Tax=Lipomyces doorenjongii TaxID=383834 RepID=UPI0034CF2F71